MYNDTEHFVRAYRDLPRRARRQKLEALNDSMLIHYLADAKRGSTIYDSEMPIVVMASIFIAVAYASAITITHDLAMGNPSPAEVGFKTVLVVGQLVNGIFVTVECWRKYRDIVRAVRFKFIARALAVEVSRRIDAGSKDTETAYNRGPSWEE